MTIKEKPKLTPEEAKMIATMQLQLIRGLDIAKKYLSEEEVAYTIKRSFDKEEVRLISQFL